jgi:hypothetical protein
MELIITFFIKFTLGINIIFTLLILGLSKIQFANKFNFSSTLNLLHQFYSFINFLFSKRSRRLCD